MTTSLIKEYFRNYKCVVYLAQFDDPVNCHKAPEIAGYLGLSLTIIETGYGFL
jgi:hypothetical protein